MSFNNFHFIAQILDLLIKQRKNEQYYSCQSVSNKRHHPFRQVSHVSGEKMKNEDAIETIFFKLRYACVTEIGNTESRRVLLTSNIRWHF